MARSSIVSKALLLLMFINIGPHLGVAAQKSYNAPSAIFTGRIVDREGIGIPDASVLIENNYRIWNLRSDKNGEFKVALPTATFRITIERVGFKKLIVTDFIINAGSPVSHSFPMDIDCCIDVALIKPAIPSNNLPINRFTALPQPNIDVNGYFSSDKAQRGRIVQAAIVIDIPSGYHINSNRPLESYLIPTQLKVDAPSAVRVGPIVYPRASLRTFKFSKKQLSVYEGRAILRFNITLPANYSGGSMDLKARVRLQSCNDEVCFPPKNQDVNMRIDVAGVNDRVQRVNGWVFGRR